MQVDLVKKVYVSEDKVTNVVRAYTFLYLKCESGKLVPINVRLERNEDGKVRNYSDNDILKALATHMICKNIHGTVIFRLHDGKRPVALLQFVKAGVHASVRIKKSVAAEITVVLHAVSEIAAVAVFLAAVRCLTKRNGMIAPFPNTSAHQFRVIVNQIPIGFQISVAVAHRVGILAKKIRFCIRFILQIFMNIRKR